MRKSFFPSALIAGLIAGTLDITAACIQAYLKNDTTPTQVLKYVASGAVDPKTFSNDTILAAVGLIVHFIIAISFTFFFFFLAKQIPALVRYPIPVGILYGVFVWATMRFIILPYVSRINPKPIAGNEAVKNAAIAAGILVVCIGIPVALLARKYIKAILPVKS
jgi:uncharacterized membrane protein YagU involved in acid resistance